MHRTTLSKSSRAEIMITGTSRSTGSDFICLEHLHPVELGHDDVEQDDVPRPGAERLERLATVLGRAHLVPGHRQRAGEQRPVHPVVVDDEDRARGRRRHGAAPRSRSATSCGRTSAPLARRSPRSAEPAPLRSPARAACLELATETLEPAGAEHRRVRLQGVGGASDEGRVAGGRSVAAARPVAEAPPPGRHRRSRPALRDRRRGDPRARERRLASSELSPVVKIGRHTAVSLRA